MSRQCSLIMTSFWVLMLLTSCDTKQYDFPKYGRVQIAGQDTTYHKIPPFEYLNQDSVLISNKTLSDQIYVADFFFTFCPSICPEVMTQMIRIHENFADDDRLALLSFALAPDHDDVPTLKLYADNLGVDQTNWHFLTGDQDSIFDLARSFLVSAMLDEEAPGGIEHSGKILLVDKEGHIRAFCDGTEPDEVDIFIDKISFFLSEKF